jgi:hypothetical protein
MTMRRDREGEDVAEAARDAVGIGREYDDGAGRAS